MATWRIMKCDDLRDHMWATTDTIEYTNVIFAYFDGRTSYFLEQSEPAKPWWNRTALLQLYWTSSLGICRPSSGVALDDCDELLLVERRLHSIRISFTKSLLDLSQSSKVIKTINQAFSEKKRSISPEMGMKPHFPEENISQADHL